MSKSTKPTKIMNFPDMGREAWAKWDADAEIYEVFASSACDDFIGDADTIEDAKQVARDWANDMMD